MRFGEDPGNSGYDILNFSAPKNLEYQARVFVNTDKGQFTIGFTGFNDPDNVLALRYDSDFSDQWHFQGIREKREITAPTGFVHTPGRWFTVRIKVEWGEVPTAKLFLDSEAEPRVVLGAEYIPVSGLCAELQVWNVKLEDGSYSQPTLYADYLSIMQDR
jgi:hypothetical protein